MATDHKMRNSSDMMHRKAGFALVGLALLALALGCGSDRERGSVSGRVTSQGQPVSEGTIIFADEEWGTFVTASIRNGDYSIPATDHSGLWVNGVYQVAVTPPAPQVPPGQVKPVSAPKAMSAIPEKYRNPKTSGLTFELTSSTGQYDVDLKP